MWNAMQEKTESDMSNSESQSELSFRVNGWRQKDYSGSSLELKSDIKGIEIRTLADFCSKLNELNGISENPFFYRGHNNLNYILIPGIMRTGMKNEHLLFNEFAKRFSSKISVLPSTLDKLILMQHYRLNTRLLDITENPLVALFFACYEEPKFPIENQNYRYGCVMLFREQNPDELKYSNSLTAKVIANTALVEEEFDYKKLQQRFYEDYSAEWLRDFIYFKDIVRRSIIIRTSRENPRIINQSGAFILVNANKLIKIEDSNGKSSDVSSAEFMKWMMTEGGKSNFTDIHENSKNKFHSEFKDFKRWTFLFRKVKPYSLENKCKEFQDDPFDLKRLFYTDKNGKHIVFFIPPDCKKKILEELNTVNINECTMYPEMEHVALYLNEKFKNQ